MEKNFALHATNKKYSNSRVTSEKKILNETKNHNTPLQVKWSVPYKTLFLSCWINFLLLMVFFYFLQANLFSRKYMINSLEHGIFHIGPGISPRLISALGSDMTVSGWYQGRYGKCHVIICNYITWFYAVSSLISGNGCTI